MVSSSLCNPGVLDVGATDFLASRLPVILWLLVLVCAVALWVGARLRRNERLARYRATCSGFGLRRGAEGWEGTLHGVPVLTTWTRERAAPDGGLRWYSKYAARIEPRLDARMVVYARHRTGPNHTRESTLQRWRDRDAPLPAHVVLADLELDARVTTFAHDAPQARKLLLRASDAIVALVLDGQTVDLRITDEEVELLRKPWNRTSEQVGAGLEGVIGIVRALTNR